MGYEEKGYGGWGMGDGGWGMGDGEEKKKYLQKSLVVSFLIIFFAAEYRCITIWQTNKHIFPPIPCTPYTPQ
jgi:hypothetical protein